MLRKFILESLIEISWSVVIPSIRPSHFFSEMILNLFRYLFLFFEIIWAAFFASRILKSWIAQTIRENWGTRETTWWAAKVHYPCLIPNYKIEISDILA